MYTDKKKSDCRIEVRDSKENKELLTDEKSFLDGQRDQQIFFSALMGNEEKPNQGLLSAIKFYNQISE